MANCDQLFAYVGSYLLLMTMARSDGLPDWICPTSLNPQMSINFQEPEIVAHYHSDDKKLAST